MTTKIRKRSLPTFVALIGVLLMSSGFAVMASAGSASATQTEGPCNPDWQNVGGLVTTHDNDPPGENTDYVRWLAAGSEKHVTQEFVPGVPGKAAIWANFAPDDQQATFIGPAIWDTDPRGKWNVHDQIPPGHAGPDGVYAQGNPDKGGNWFYRQAAVPAVPAIEEKSHTDYFWQKQIRDKCDTPDPEPDLATASVTPIDPTCEDPNGSFTTSMTNATISEGQASGDGVPGASVSVTFTANEGAEFEDGTTSKKITVNFAAFDETECGEVAGPPGEEPPAAAPPVNNPPAKAPIPTKRATSAVAGPTTSTPSSTVAGPTIPSTVKAGLGEDVAELAATRTSQGLALVGAGALVMLAGGLGMVRRRGVVARI